MLNILKYTEMLFLTLMMGFHSSVYLSGQSKVHEPMLHCVSEVVIMMLLQNWLKHSQTFKVSPSSTISQKFLPPKFRFRKDQMHLKGIRHYSRKVATYLYKIIFHSVVVLKS